MTDQEKIAQLQKELASAERYAEEMHYKLSLYKMRVALDSNEVPEDVEVYVKGDER